MTTHRGSPGLLRSFSLRDYPGYGRYPFNVPLLSAMTGPIEFSPLTVITGPNGVGKTALLQALALLAGLPALGGSEQFPRRSSPVDDLADLATLSFTPPRPRHGFHLTSAIHHLEEELDRQAAADPDFLDAYGGQRLSELSSGQKALAVMTHRFRPGGLYLLDEPEAHLHPERLRTLANEINRQVAEGSQFIIVAHSVLLVTALDTPTILEADDTGVLRHVGVRESHLYASAMATLGPSP
ncbi:hypothetical protein E1200_22015 [Actinomadura sp. GC306]|uniref:AAA family ATPase n=1 Tax=Actinomadura sp. GC306 TaxID=2530367 RepID=UPI001047D429|nr:AAA family ATPase [Actinomadura sp. GC306]TDC63557.1 hypothetical protein E1200_22015 [Actinomadura sp. GC306]